MESLEFVNSLKDTLITYTCERGTFDTTIQHAHLKEMEQLEKDLHELAQYRALAEEIGCPVDVLHKALKDGFYVDMTQVKKIPNWEEPTGIKYIGCPKYFRFNLWYKTIEVDRFGHYLEVQLKDYKKTWWLKADRSE